jgi:acyl carrier protein
MSEVQTRVVKLVAEHLDVDPSKVQAESRFQEDLGADSLDQVEMVMAFEEAFSIEIPDNAAEKIVKVSDAVKFIEEQVKKAA